ncbi:MAG: hypothetical protein EBU08_20890 [Micrococcales bacterium]|nr:hypothetical protein [Micrococcales bacterium]
MSDSDSDTSTATPMLNLYEQLIQLKHSADLLKHRVDTIEHLLDHEPIFTEIPLRVAPKRTAQKVRELLTAMDLQEEGLTLESFLRTLNKYLIRQELVDLNDLQIHLSPLVAAAFHKPIGLKKVPYALLLLALPSMFC